jgi:lysophospholipase L1-like esterase
LAFQLLATISGMGRPARAGSRTYLSLGDSIAFGSSDFTQDPSFGDRGYVKGFADFLAGSQGGVRPNVINLAIDGETTASFGTGAGRVPPGPGFPDAALASLNLNYDPAALVTQQQKLLETVAAQHALGNAIGNVTISLGGNDLFALALSSGFQSADPAGQQALLLQALGAIASRQAALLTALHGLAPEAAIFVLGQYNPFPADPSSPLGGIAGPAILGLNATLAAVAPAYGATYVDLYSAFLGHETELTLFKKPDYNIHPNADGYSVITARLTAAAVPEPSSIAWSPRPFRWAWPGW